MIDIVWNFLFFVIALGILVAVHEFGHFWVARKCGIKVHTFSIGFGKSIWSKIGKDGTEYTIAMIPLGGYVKMLDGRVDELSDNNRHQAFDLKPIWQRTAVIAAGPVFNFLFAILAYWLVFMVGVPAVKPVIGEVNPTSISAQAGIEPGMELKSISGVQTPDWESVNMQIIAHIGEDSMELKLADKQTIGSEQSVILDLTQWQFDPEQQSSMDSLGFQPYRPKILPVISHISQGGAGERAGLLVDDHVVAIDGESFESWEQLVAAIKAHPNQELSVTVRRNGELRDIVLVPEAKEQANGSSFGFAGIAPKMEPWPDEYQFELKFGVFESVVKAVEKTGQLVELTASMLKKLVVGDIGLNNLSGPISIAQGAGTTADYGFVYFFGFLALISVNLGLINLVPLPMLDGGHLLFLAIESVTGKPVPEKIQDIGYRIGGAVILSMMLIAVFNDFARL